MVHSVQMQDSVEDQNPKLLIDTMAMKNGSARDARSKEIAISPSSVADGAEDGKDSTSVE